MFDVQPKSMINEMTAEEIRTRLKGAPNRADGPTVCPDQTHLNAVQVTT